jgi:hypothetical protein
MSTLPHPQLARATQRLRQALNLWPYLFVGISVVGLAYEFWQSR